MSGLSLFTGVKTTFRYWRSIHSGLTKLIKSRDGYGTWYLIPSVSYPSLLKNDIPFLYVRCCNNERVPVQLLARPGWSGQGIPIRILSLFYPELRTTRAELLALVEEIEWRSAGGDILDRSARLGA